MIKRVEDGDCAEWEVIDLDTVEKIRGCQYVNDDDGYLVRILLDENGDLKVNDITGEFITIREKRNIKLVKKEQYGKNSRNLDN